MNLCVSGNRRETHSLFGVAERNAHTFLRCYVTMADEYVTSEISDLILLAKHTQVVRKVLEFCLSLIMRSLHLSFVLLHACSSDRLFFFRTEDDLNIRTIALHILGLFF
jgi:hypothetical protein